MRIRNLMDSVILSVKKYQSMQEAFELWQEKGRPEVVPIVAQSVRPVGLLTERDFLEYLLEINSGCKATGSASTSQATSTAKAKASVAHWASGKWAIVPAESSPEEVWPVSVPWLLAVDESGRLVGTLNAAAVARAMTERYQGRIKQLESILESAHNAIIAIDKDGLVTFYNEAAEKLVWRPKADVIGKHLSQVVIPLGLLDILKTGEKQYGYKFTIRYSRGPRTYLTNRTPIVEDGEVVGAVGVFQDVSEMEGIAEELTSVKNLNSELEAIIEASYDGIIITDAEGRILRVNRAHARLSGLTPEAIVGKTMEQLVKEGLLSASLVDPVLKARSAVSMVVETGSGNQLLVTGNPVFDSQGEVRRVVLNVRDLSELNDLKTQLEATRELSLRYQAELQELRSRMNNQNGIVINSVAMEKVIDLALRVARVDSTVLILGESGVGKDVVARIIHNNSPRQSGPFIKINCGAIPESLLESELFGYEPGAFSGASREGKPGMFELAHNGTLFLDEIAELPLALQVKLLRAIQDREIVRVGGVKARQINVRIIAATNQDLQAMVEEGRFREDLYFRLNVVPIKVPPLRERKEEIIPMAREFLKRFRHEYKLEKDFSPEVWDAFLQYAWPGNVRELQNMVERLLVTAPGPVITKDNLPIEMAEPGYQVSRNQVTVSGILPLKQAVDEVERQLIEKAVNVYGSTYKAAKALKVNQSTVARKLNKYRRAP